NLALWLDRGWKCRSGGRGLLDFEWIVSGVATDGHFERFTVAHRHGFDLFTECEQFESQSLRSKKQQRNHHEAIRIAKRRVRHCQRDVWRPARGYRGEGPYHHIDV